MTNALIYHLASGHAFFTGIALINVAVILAFRADGRWSARCRTVLACLGLILIVASATPLPSGLYFIAFVVSLPWVGLEGMSQPFFPRGRVRLRIAVLGVWLVGAAMELPFHRIPVVTPMGHSVLWIVGDSIAAGTGGESETWPRLIARDHRVAVQDLSIAGATAGPARRQALRIVGSRPLVLAEIGGNDILAGTPPDAFEKSLDALLADLRGAGRTVVMLELPLPPFCNRYGAIQRRVARRRGALLVPKRILLGVLTTPGATVDSLHLSRSGHELMARTLWPILRPGF